MNLLALACALLATIVFDSDTADTLAGRHP